MLSPSQSGARAASGPGPSESFTVIEGSCCTACAEKPDPVRSSPPVTAGTIARPRGAADPPALAQPAAQQPAAARATTPSTPLGPPPVPVPLTTGPRPPLDRSADRAITVAGLAVAAAFLVLAGASAAVPGLAGGTWLPLHLVLAGAATTAIGAVMPFFSAALVAARPASARSRIAVLVLVAAGALGVTAGVRAGIGALSTAGGVSFLAGAGLLGLVVIRILRGSLNARRRVFAVIYGGGIVNVIVGASLATLVVAGSREVAAGWGGLKPAHAWLNLFGFVGLVIAASLIHLYPTVLGTRIRQSRAGYAAVVLLLAGPPIVALGFAMDQGLVARAGAAVAVAGALALVAHAAQAWRVRGRWASDAPWHRFAIGSLSAAIGWFAVGTVLAAGLVLVEGTSPAAWSLAAVAAPLGLGCVVQALAGSWTHLIPSIGPGDPARHARQRVVLGRLSAGRLVAFQLGVAAVAIGMLAGRGVLTVAGGTLVIGSTAVSLMLFVVAVFGPLRAGRTTMNAAPPRAS